MSRDPIHLAVRWLDHNRYTVLGLCAVAASLVYLTACVPTVTTPDGVRQTRGGLERWAIVQERDLAARRFELNAAISVLNAEIEAHNRSLASFGDDLARQEAFRSALVEIAGGVVTQAVSGGVNPVGIAATGVALLGVLGGVGAVADNRRKDAIIRSAREPTGPREGASP